MSVHHKLSEALAHRRAGVLLHPTCLPSQHGLLGNSARRFVDFMTEAGLSVWQTLPLGPTHADLSPYQSLSAHAGNQDFIGLEDLAHAGLISESELDGVESRIHRQSLIATACERFFNHTEGRFHGLTLADFEAFRTANGDWLEDYCLFCAIREVYPEGSWLSWPPELRNRDPVALEHFSATHAETLRRLQFEQFLFDFQWSRLREYAHERGILMFGDIPIFVAHDSADVWAAPHLFKLKISGEPEFVAGVPPDYFSPEGQHWGNPLYDWSAMAQDGYQWWISRLETQRHFFDLIRIDHFRGLQAYWEIPAAHPTPKNGYWAAGPGADFLDACLQQFPDLPLVAENLGMISDDVEALRHHFRLPGMTVIQFGFDGSAANPHLVHNHHRGDLVYSGTHDNDTTLGWYLSLDEHTRKYVDDYLGHSSEPMPWPAIRTAFQSACQLAVIPMQDLLGLDSRGRFNTPGTTTGNWAWKLDWSSCPPSLAGHIHHLVRLYGRLP